MPENSNLEHFIARQPILDAKQRIFAYELLFRSGLDNYFGEVDADEATSRVIADSFLLFGIETMTGGAKAFINFTREILVREYATVLPPEYTVIEILENVEPDEEVIAACRGLKNKGYLLALDDFVYHPRLEPLTELADIIKVDFIISGEEERRKIADTFLPRGIKLLAEKVETMEEFTKAVGWGYSYFQGYFFSKPTIISKQDVPGFKLNLLRILQEANAPEMDFDRLAEMIKQEVSVSYKLLRYVNSVAFGLTQKISSIKRALGMLGENGTRKLVSLVTLADMGQDKAAELLVSSLARAKFCEKTAERTGLAHRSAELFLMGLFSQLDAIMGQPLQEILAELALAEDIKEALLGKKGKLRYILLLVVSFEKGAWKAMTKLAAAVGVKESDLPEIYFEAVKWPREILSE